jgi:glycosyltransferase involved in cell wall biosynthesis
VREAFKLADKVLFNAPFLAADVYRSFVYQLPARRVVVINNGIAPKPRDVSPAAKPEGTFRILCVASIYQRKRQLDLVKAVLALNRPDVECWLVGEIQPNEPGLEDLMAQIRQQPEIFHLTGSLPPREVHRLYASADLFCLPSGDESFGRAPLEAGQHGLPAVLTDLPAYRDIWLHGWNALLYQAGDIRMLAWMLRIPIEDAELRWRLGEEARKTASRFGDGPTLAAVEAAIEEAVMIRRNGERR